MPLLFLVDPTAHTPAAGLCFLYPQRSLDSTKDLV
jgi:hypothetical protein